MNLTEAEARTKWCPLARPITNAIDETPATNGTRSMTCIASDCMAWREGVKSGTGRCGLAGAP